MKNILFKTFILVFLFTTSVSAKDWEIVFLKFAKEKAEAMSFEKHIKKAKSRKYILELIHSDKNQADKS